MRSWSFLAVAACVAAAVACSSSDSTPSGTGGSAGSAGSAGSGGTAGSAGSDAASDGPAVCPGTTLPSSVTRADFEACVDTDINDPWTCWVCANCLTEVNACWGDPVCDAAQLAFDTCVGPDGGDETDAGTQCVDSGSATCLQKAACASPLAVPYLLCVAGAP